jgi:hypothetical protein
MDSVHHMAYQFSQGGGFLSTVAGVRQTSRLAPPLVQGPNADQELAHRSGETEKRILTKELEPSKQIGSDPIVDIMGPAILSNGKLSLVQGDS